MWLQLYRGDHYILPQSTHISAFGDLWNNLQGSLLKSSQWQSWEHLQGHYNCISRNFHAFYMQWQVPVESLFTDCSHLQYLITYSMQIRKRKAWEIWSCVMTSGRRMVDTQGAVHNNSRLKTVSNHPWCLANALSSSPQTGSTRMASRFFVRRCPLCVYPCVPDVCNCMVSDLPGLPLPYLHTVSDHIYWRWERPGNEGIPVAFQL